MLAVPLAAAAHEAHKRTSPVLFSQAHVFTWQHVLVSFRVAVTAEVAQGP